MMALRTLKPSDGFSDLAPGLELAPLVAERRAAGLLLQEAAASRRPAPEGTEEAKGVGGPDAVYTDLHVFYYTWYGTPRFDSRYVHWDHVMVPHWDPKISASYPKGRHHPPEDIGASFYPALGPYSSRDPAVLEEHMTQLRAAAIGNSARMLAPRLRKGVRVVASVPGSASAGMHEPALGTCPSQRQLGPDPSRWVCLCQVI